MHSGLSRADRKGGRTDDGAQIRLPQVQGKTFICSQASHTHLPMALSFFFPPSVLEVLSSNFSEVTWYRYNNPTDSGWTFWILGLLASHFLGSGHIVVFLSKTMIWNLEQERTWPGTRPGTGTGTGLGT
jgi:hypothetical protein